MIANSKISTGFFFFFFGMKKRGVLWWVEKCPSKDVHLLILESVNMLLPGKRDFTDMIKLRILIWTHFSQWAQDNCMGP